jgi:hypothetical protein
MDKLTSNIQNVGLNNFHEYLIQHSLKSRGIQDQVKESGTAPY